MAYRDGVPAVIESLLRRETPVRLRLWAGLATGAAAVLLIALTLVMTGVREQVRLIGQEAAPQAVTSADLYFALSDLDAQATRILLTGDSDELAGSRIDALGAYRARGYQVDQDLQRSLTTGAGEEERAIVLRLMDGLTVYRQRVGQALAAGASTEPGRLSPDALGYYTQATNLLHLRLLPDAQRLRDDSMGRLDDAYAAKGATEATGTAVVVLLGGTLLALLVMLQVWMARRFHRTLNPALVTATVLSVLLLLSAAVVLQLQSRRLSDGRDDGLGPYLALSELRALGYDAAADTGRYLVSANLSYYRDDFTEKSACLSGDVTCKTAALTPLTWDLPAGDETVTSAASARGGLPRLAGAEVVTRWTAYRTVHERILTLADTGQTAEAVRLLTGIRRGDAAFDFAYFDASVAGLTGAREQEFDRALRAAENTLTGWALLPGVILTVVLALIPFGVRKRLAEYR